MEKIILNSKRTDLSSYSLFSKLMFRYKANHSIFILFMLFSLLPKFEIYALYVLIFFLPFYIIHKNINDNSELYHLVTGNSYSKFLIRKTMVLAFHINLQYVFFVIVINFFKYFYQSEDFFFKSLFSNFLIFNAGLFIAFLLGDLVRLSDANEFSMLVNKVLSYLLFQFIFLVCFFFILMPSLIFNENIYLQFIILLISVTSWYFHSKYYKTIRYKQIIIPTIYDKN